VIISVADQGPGIADDQKQLIFEKFYRQSDNVSGAGLGLAICKGIVEAHGKNIWVEDRPGGGAIFKFALPAVESDLQDNDMEPAVLDVVEQK
jgi:two-component system sensor histidine kinase KdpD